MVQRVDCLEAVFQDFLDKFDLDYTVRLGDCFEYHFQEDIIQIALSVPAGVGDAYMEYAFEHGLEYDCGTAILCFLHEVGHGETGDFLDEEEDAACEEQKKEIGTSLARCKEYFDVEDEFLATQWGIDFVNEHPDDIKDLALRYQDELQRFFEANGVTND